MAAHGYHPRQHKIADIDNPEPVFFDGCEECDRKSAQPLTWAPEVFDAVWRKMLAVDYGITNGTTDLARTRGYRSHAEAVAARCCYHLAILLERHFGLKPGDLITDTHGEELRQSLLAWIEAADAVEEG